MIYLTSDLHLCHDREFVYGPRGFTSIAEHNREVVNRWNSVVTDEDEVYLLGDLMLNDNELGMALFKALRGKIHIILGNHDTASRQKLYPERPNTDILGYATMFKYNGYHFYLSHYPTLTANLSEDIKGLRASVLNLFGHTHQQKNFYNDIPMMYHVGMDSHNCTPVSIDQVIEEIRAEAHKCLDMLQKGQEQ